MKKEKGGREEKKKAVASLVSPIMFFMYKAA